jgi:hypothetical protein
LYVKKFLRGHEDLPVPGRLTSSKIRKHVLEALGALVYVEHFYKSGETWAG